MADKKKPVLPIPPPDPTPVQEIRYARRISPPDPTPVQEIRYARIARLHAVARENQVRSAVQAISRDEVALRLLENANAGQERDLRRLVALIIRELLQNMGSPVAAETINEIITESLRKTRR